MGYVAFQLEEKGEHAGSAGFRVDEQVGPDDFSRAVDDLVSRKALDDPETSQMIAAHFAELVITKYLADDQSSALRAANALIMVLGQPYVTISANSLRGDIEITAITKIVATSVEEAETVWLATYHSTTNGRSTQQG